MTALAARGNRALEFARSNPWAIAIVVTIATFMEVLDVTIANVALPHIAGSLSAGQEESTWVLTSYLVSNAIVLPISGWLAALVGRKRFYMTCVALFTVSSLLCGFAPTLPFLILFRVLQGLGGGGLQPSQQAILVDTFPKRKLGMAFAVAGIATVAAPVLGPTLGGWLTDNHSWRWVFFINVPVGLVGLLLSHLVLHDPPEKRARARGKGFTIDYTGIGLVAICLGCLQILLDKGQQEDWFQSAFIVTLAVVSGSALLIGIWWELRHKHPVVDLPLLRNRNFGLATVLMFGLGVMLFSSTVLIPLMVQSLMGYTALWAGLVLSPAGLVVLVMMPFVGFMINRVQAKWLIVFGSVTLGVALLHMANFSLEMGFWHLLGARCFQSLGLAFLFIPINTAAYAFIQPDKNANASALLNVARNLGGSVGIALATTFLARRTQFHQVRLVEHVSTYSLQTREALDQIGVRFLSYGSSPVEAAQQALAVLGMETRRQAAMLAYLDSYWIIGVASLFILPALALFMKDIRHGHDKSVAAH